MPRPATGTTHAPVRSGLSRRALIGTLAAALVLSACTPETEPEIQPSPAPTVPTASFIFGTPAAPTNLDPALTRDAESLRVTRQIMEPLVGSDPSNSAPTPALAKAWTASSDSRTWTFTLRENVTFHDGTPFNANAVCANFERWYHFPESLRKTSTATPFSSIFGAFSDRPELSTYGGCSAENTTTVKLTLNQPFPALLKALSSPAFAIASPAALEKLAADKQTGARNGTPVSEFGLAPVGTGPYRFVSWHDGDVVLASYEKYWGKRGQIKDLTFRTLTDSQQRLDALSNETIDGFDGVRPENFTPLAQAGKSIAQRDPLAVTYLGINRSEGPLTDERVRRAVALAIDKQSLTRNYFLSGTPTAKQFVPPALGVNSETVEEWGTDVNRARALLADSPYDGEPIQFRYPLRTVTPWVTTPERVYAEIARQLTAVGFNIQPVPIEWSDGYEHQVLTESHGGLSLMGLDGSYRDPDAFLGTLFGAPSPQFSWTNNQVFSKLSRARTLPDGPDRVAAYKNITDQIADELPAVPLAFPISAVALSPKVASYPISATRNEVFNAVQLR